MDFLGAVQTIGDRLTEIDMTIARLPPKDPNALELTALRAKLDEQQRALVKMAFDENTAAFQQAATDLAAVNKSIGKSIQNIGQIATAIDDVTRFLASVTNLVTTASKLA